MITSQAEAIEEHVDLLYSYHKQLSPNVAPSPFDAHISKLKIESIFCQLFHANNADQTSSTKPEVGGSSCRSMLDGYLQTANSCSLCELPLPEDMKERSMFLDVKLEPLRHCININGLKVVCGTCCDVLNLNKLLQIATSMICKDIDDTQTLSTIIQKYLKLNKFEASEGYRLQHAITTAYALRIVMK